MPRKDVKNLEERCEAYVFDMYGEKIKGRCVNRRHFRINGKELCGRHAALEAFAVQFAKGKIAIIVQHQPKMYGPVRTEWKP